MNAESTTRRRIAVLAAPLMDFLAMLGSVGGKYDPGFLEGRDFSKPVDGRRAAARHARPLNMKSYIERHGTVYHRKMKRPPNMSARQWKKFYKAMRRAGKSQAAA